MAKVTSKTENKVIKKISARVWALLLIFVFIFCAQFAFVGATEASNLTNLGVYGSSSSSSSSDVYLPDDKGLPEGDIESILTSLLTWLLGIIGIIGIISFVISGIQYLLSFGDEKNMETAKRNLYYSIIGVVVALSGFIAVKAIDIILNAGSNF